MNKTEELLDLLEKRNEIALSNHDIKSKNVMLERSFKNICTFIKINDFVDDDLKEVCKQHPDIIRYVDKPSNDLLKQSIEERPNLILTLRPSQISSEIGLELLSVALSKSPELKDLFSEQLVEKSNKFKQSKLI